MQLIVSKPRNERARLLALGVCPRLYGAWLRMRDRCRNTRTEKYHRYGGRGIGVCERWAKFDNFAVDMGPHPGKGWTLDRKNNDGNYNKRNCQWATRTAQARNRSSTKLTAKSAAKLRRLAGSATQTELAKRFSVSQATVSQVLLGNYWK